MVALAKVVLLVFYFFYSSIHLMFYFNTFLTFVTFSFILIPLFLEVTGPFLQGTLYLYIFFHSVGLHVFKQEYRHYDKNLDATELSRKGAVNLSPRVGVASGEDLNAATESAVTTSV